MNVQTNLLCRATDRRQLDSGEKADISIAKKLYSALLCSAN